METIVIGDPATGLVEATSGTLLTAPLTGCGETAVEEWKLSRPRSPLGDGPYGGLELNGDSLATIPAISADNFGHAHPPNVGYARLHGRNVPKYFDQPVGPDNILCPSWANFIRMGTLVTSVRGLPPQLRVRRPNVGCANGFTVNRPRNAPLLWPLNIPLVGLV